MSQLLSLLHPRPLYQSASALRAQGTWWSGLAALLAYSAVFGLLQSLTALLNADVLNEAHQAWLRAAALSGAPAIEATITPSPWRPFLFPLYWLAYAGFSTAVRWGMASLQALELGLARITLVSAWAAIPFAISGGLLGILNLLFPYSPDNYAVGRIWLSVLAVFIAFAWEGLIFVRGAAQSDSARRGPIALVWLTPALLALVLVSLYIFVAQATT